jgi:hypothetical protein
MCCVVLLHNFFYLANGNNYSPLKIDCYETKSFNYPGIVCGNDSFYCMQQ